MDRLRQSRYPTQGTVYGPFFSRVWRPGFTRGRSSCAARAACLLRTPSPSPPGHAASPLPSADPADSPSREGRPFQMCSETLARVFPSSLGPLATIPLFPISSHQNTGLWRTANCALSHDTNPNTCLFEGAVVPALCPKAPGQLWVLKRPSPSSPPEGLGCRACFAHTILLKAGLQLDTVCVCGALSENTCLCSD